MKRKIEIIAFEHERISVRSKALVCPVCGSCDVALTTAEAAALAKVSAASIRRWLAKGLSHATKTVGGRYLVCRRSLFAGENGCMEKEKENEKVLHPRVSYGSIPAISAHFNKLFRQKRAG